jgi:2-polyprenyl-6-methoxyphenol hydroxylase-like FAD-dependent oxidoreductase
LEAVTWSFHVAVEHLTSDRGTTADRLSACTRQLSTLKPNRLHLPGSLIWRLLANNPVWLSGFAINERKVADYRAQRVFLAGDAVHSPAGGQGMNTGMQDAFNLAWKLSLATRGLCAAGPLLASYSPERSAVAKMVLEQTGRTTAIASKQDKPRRRTFSYPSRAAPDLIQIPKKRRGYEWSVLPLLSSPTDASASLSSGECAFRGLGRISRQPAQPVL